MPDYEVFRITPEVGEKCYEYAEADSRLTKGNWPNQKFFTNVPPLYVGRLIRFVTGGYGDNGWRTDYFEDNTGREHVVNYSYEGNTCFHEVPCLPNVIPSLVKQKLDYSKLPKDDPQRIIIEQKEVKKEDKIIL